MFTLKCEKVAVKKVKGNAFLYSYDELRRYGEKSLSLHDSH